MDRMNDLLKGDPFGSGNNGRVSLLEPTSTTSENGNGAINGGPKLSSSSSSSGSDSSSSSSSSSGSDSSDDDDASSKSSFDSNEDIVPANQRTFNAAALPSSNILNGNGNAKKASAGLGGNITKKKENGKVVASGTVVNDKIRVVPIKEKKIKKEIKGTDGVGNATAAAGKNSRKKLKKKELLEMKLDPSFRSHVKIGAGKKKNKNGMAAGGGDPMTPEDATAIAGANINGTDEKLYTLRDRKERKYMSDNYLFNLQHQATYREFFSKKKKGVGALKEQNNSKHKEPPRKPMMNKDPVFPKEGDLDTDTPVTRVRRSGITANWDDYLCDPNWINWEWVAPVFVFKHAPMSDIWKDYFKTGMLFEVPNIFVMCSKPVYWLARILTFAGYKALVAYETFDEDLYYIAWISLCSDVPKPVGYCVNNDILLFPPYEVYKKNPDFLKKLIRLLQDKKSSGDFKTVPADHHSIVKKAIEESQLYKLNQPVEAIDWTRSPDCMSLGNVVGIIGNRIHVKFTDKDEEDAGFWFSCPTPSIHEFGWCKNVGVPLHADPELNLPLGKPSLKYIRMPLTPKNNKINIKEGMVFETVHPIDIHSIAAAKVAKILKHGYFIAEIKGNPPHPTVQTILHVTSPFVLPVGFAQKYQVVFVSPTNENREDFKWSTYIRNNKLTPLDLSALRLGKPSHGFARGAKLEAIDLRQPTFLGPATVVVVLEHLLLIHFDGYKRENTLSYQIVDAESADIFPCGWAEMVGHQFQSSPEYPKACDNDLVSVSSELDLDDEYDNQSKAKVHYAKYQ